MKSEMRFTAEEQIREFYNAKRSRAARTALTWSARGKWGGFRRLAATLNQIDKLESEAVKQLRRQARRSVPSLGQVLAVRQLVAPAAVPFPGKLMHAEQRVAPLAATTDGVVLGKGGKPKRVRRWAKKPEGWVETPESRRTFEAARVAMRSNAALVRRGGTDAAAAVNVATALIGQASKAPPAAVVVITDGEPTVPGAATVIPVAPPTKPVLAVPTTPVPAVPTKPAAVVPTKPILATAAKPEITGATAAEAKAPGTAEKPAEPVTLPPPFPGGPEFSPHKVALAARALGDRLLQSFTAECQAIGSVTLDNPPARNAPAKLREEAAYLLHNRRVEKLNKLFYDCTREIEDWARIEREPLNSAKERFYGSRNIAEGAIIDQLGAWVNCVNRAAKQVTDRISAVHQRADGLLKQALRRHLQEV